MTMLITSFECYSDDYHYYNGHASGWHWYAPEDEENKTKKSESPQVLTAENATAQLKSLQDKVKAATALAVLNPTTQNVANYIRLQNQVNEQATLFAKTWQIVLRQEPELDYSLQHPTNTSAKRAKEAMDNKVNDDVLKIAAKHYGLFFFFEGKCPYCQKLAPILLKVSQQYGFDVLPITIDGLSLASFPHPIKNHGQAEKLKVKLWPALFMADTNTGVISPVTFGLVSEVELKKRFIMAAKEIEAHEKTNR